MTHAPRCRYSCPHYLRQQRRIQFAHVSSSHCLVLIPTSLRSIVHVAKSRCVPDSPPFLVNIPLKAPNFRCAFVNFKDRISVERAAESWANGRDMDGKRLGVR
jgi:hypothetical protein